jgi:hypothetical protein
VEVDEQIVWFPDRVAVPATVATNMLAVEVPIVAAPQGPFELLME